MITCECRLEPWSSRFGGLSMAGWLSGFLYSRYPEHPKLLLQGGMLLGIAAAFSYAARDDLEV